jgi:hypothetical protein
MTAMIVSAFPGIGKTHVFNNPPLPGLTILDSDSSQFSWAAPGERHPEFPANYIEHIKSHRVGTDIILVSSHKEVRAALVEAKLPFALVFPNRDLKAAYVERFIRRGSSVSFIKLVETKWDEWITELEAQVGCFAITINDPRIYLSDVLCGPCFYSTTRRVQALEGTYL